LVSCSSNIGGNALREIVNLSKGAQIIILSDKFKEQPGNETVAIIVGKLETKAEAAVIITEKIAAYRCTYKVEL
jgi:hypothetical protein